MLYWHSVRVLVLLGLVGAAAACSDTPPDNKYTCAQQKSWGKCNASWMQAHCCQTCFDCNGPGCAPTPPPPPSQPCDPKATPAVHELLKIIQRVQSEGRVITGQVESDEHDDAAGGSKTFTNRDWDKVASITGTHPGMWGSQFLWGPTAWAQPYRQQMVDHAASLWQNTTGRVLVHINFHVCPPTEKFNKYNCSWHDIEGSDLNPPSLGTAILTNGTVENAIWMEQLDVMAGFLGQLQAKDVPVLWRPFHEANGGWFWWGKQPRFTELWKQMYDRFTVHWGLHNLLWVYGPSGQFPIGPQYPGHTMVDLLGQDTYAKAADQTGFTESAYQDLVSTANGKPVALTEIGLAPGPEVLSSQKHSYALMWGGFESKGNTPAGLKAFYANPLSVNRGDPLLLREETEPQ